MMMRKAIVFAPIVLLAATACGGPGGGSHGQAGTGDSAYPPELVGTWKNHAPEVGPDDAYKFSLDGSCVWKLPGVASEPCRYTVSTGGVSHPATSQSWIVQVSADQNSTSLEVVALDSTEMTVRDGQKLWTYHRASNDEVKDCVGADAPGTCAALGTQQSCEAVPGCTWFEECAGDQPSCPEFGKSDCPSGCSWQTSCDGNPQPCISLEASDCTAYSSCHLQ